MVFHHYFIRLLQLLYSKPLANNKQLQFVHFDKYGKIKITHTKKRKALVISSSGSVEIGNGEVMIINPFEI